LISRIFIEAISRCNVERDYECDCFLIWTKLEVFNLS
jgi:hypothetical protein